MESVQALANRLVLPQAFEIRLELVKASANRLVLPQALEIRLELVKALANRLDLLPATRSDSATVLGTRLVPVRAALLRVGPPLRFRLRPWVATSASLWR